jgi:hypothetical protein
MDKLAEWITSPAGRWAQIGAGASLVAFGLWRRRPLLAALGAIPVAGGVFDLLLISPLLAMPTTGREVGVRQDATLFPPRLRPEGLTKIA